MFRFKQEPSSGSYNQSLAKITGLVEQCVSVQTLSAPTRIVQLFPFILISKTDHIYVRRVDK